MQSALARPGLFRALAELLHVRFCSRRANALRWRAAPILLLMLASWLVALPAFAAPPYKYYVLTPEELVSDLTVTSLEPGNSVSTGSVTRSLGAYESAVIPASELHPGAIITGSASYTVASGANATDLLAPDFLAGTEFVIPHITGGHKYYVQATAAVANLTIHLGASSSSLQVTPGTAYEIDAGSDNSIAGRIVADQPVVVAHVAYVSGVARDAYPVPPVSTEVVGIRSQQAVIGAGTDGTSVTVYASDGTSDIYALNAGQKVAVTVGTGTSQGAGSALRVVANHPVAAVQYDDGDGADASAFWSPSVFRHRYAFPVNTQYVAVACLQPGAAITLFRGSTSPQTQTCSASGTDPGKAYFGLGTSGNNVSAGWYLHADAPVYVIYEAATPEDERNLSGVQAASGPALPTLDAVATPTSNNPLAVIGTAGANATVRLYVNGRLQQTTTASGAGSYSFSAELFDGNNVLHAVTVSGSDESAPSNAVQVVYNNTIPRTQSGTISSHVVWTPGSPATPYVISSTLTIAAGAKLVLQPGATLRFANGTSLTVNGVLKIGGTAQSPVTLTSNSGSPSRGNWTGVVLSATSAGSEISGAVIDWASVGVRVVGVPVTIRNSTIRNFPANSGTGVWVTGSGTAGTQIVGNTIRGVNNEGRCVFAEGTSPSILNNTLQDCDRAVYATGVGSPTIVGNLLTSNDHGIYVDGQTLTPMPVANGNRFQSNETTNYTVLNFAPGASDVRLDATGNWWGTADIATIGQRISDWTDDPNDPTDPKPSVNFANYLNAAGGVPVAGNYLIGPFGASPTALSAGVTYDVLGLLQVPAGRSLTVPAGTTLRFYHSSGALLVDGTLSVEGVSGSLAVFTSGRASKTRSDWGGIRIRPGSSVVIEYAQVQWAATTITIDDVAATVRNSVIGNFSLETASGIRVSGAGASGSVITSNTITGVNDEGQCIFAENSSPTITNNTLTNCDKGVSVAGAASPLITGNVITGNDKGIWVDGLDASPMPVANGNQIHTNDDWNYLAFNYAPGAPNLKLDATGNWWGTTDPNAIGAKISDWMDDSDEPNDVPFVNFADFLDSAGGTAVPGNYLIGHFPATSTTLVAGTTYDAIGPLLVSSGKTLTLPAGTQVRFHSGRSGLRVDGTLILQGTIADPVILTSGRATKTRGDWAGVRITAGSNSLVEYALIEWASIGVDVIGVPATIRHSTIRNFPASPGSGVVVRGSGASATQITDNVIQGVANEGRCVHTEDSSPTIANNSLRDCDRGVFVSRASAPSITGNLITSNDHGIYVDGTGGFSPAPIATANQIFSNTSVTDGLSNYRVLTFAAGAQNLLLNARGNWWGSIDPTSIAAGIVDLSDDFVSTSKPTVDYSEFLDGPGGAVVPGQQLIGPFTPSSTTLAAGTYHVLGTIFVPATRALTIPAGTTLNFYDGAALVVDGALQVTGTSSSRVRFTSPRAAPVAGDWQGIVVRGAGASVDIDQAIIEWAVRGVETRSANAIVRNSLIQRFSIAGIAMAGSSQSSQIVSNVIDNFTKVGDGINLAASSPAITSNNITRTNRAIYMSGASNPTLTGNVLTGNNWGLYLHGADSNSASAVPNPLVHNNDIFGNTTAQVELSAYGASNAIAINASGNWWGTPEPVAGIQFLFSSGALPSMLDFSDATGSSVTFDSGPPSAPGNLAAFVASPTQVHLSWSSATDDFGVAEYSIERCAGVGCTDFAEVGTSGGTGYSDTGVSSSAHYRYRVRARDAANNYGAYSSILSIVAEVDAEDPSTPTGLDASAASSRQIDVRWNAATDNSGAVEYVVERCSGAGCSNFAVVATVSKPAFRNTGLSPSTSYTYRVRAKDAAGNFSGNSNVDSVATPITGAHSD